MCWFWNIWDGDDLFRGPSAPRAPRKRRFAPRTEALHPPEGGWNPHGFDHDKWEIP